MGSAGRPLGSNGRAGTHWVITVILVLFTVPPLAWLTLLARSNYLRCLDSSAPGSSQAGDVDPGACTPAEVSYILPLRFLLVVITVTAIGGLIAGMIEGLQRWKFASGRRVCAVVLGVAQPLALASYAIGYGISRFLPKRKPKSVPIDPALQQGWLTAIRLFSALERGEEPPTILAPGYARSDRVYLDAPFNYARYYETDVTYSKRHVMASGPPLFVAGTMISDAIANGAEASRARALAAPQWREHRTARVIVTASATLCAVNGRWLEFPHNAVVEYYLTGCHCILTFAEVGPLCLSGPSAWCHAVLFAYHQYDSDRWQSAYFLREVASAARQFRASDVVDRTG
jgi:hypothetical protein